MFDGLPTRSRLGAPAPQNAIARSRELEREGYSREELRRLSGRGVFERGARGVYLTSAAARSPHRDLLIVATRVPNGVFCLLTALAFHGLTTEMPHQVWVALALKSRTPATDIPPIRTVRLSAEPLRAGMETHVVQGVELRVFSPAKTVADCFKFRSRVGTDVAAAALRDGWKKNLFTIDELWRYAGVCRVTTVIRPHLEALVA
jgi:predicted transcriptional regulator of viral defense system